MADSREGSIYWHSPDPRAIIPINNIKPPRSLKQILKKTPFKNTIDADFRRIIELCAECNIKRNETWISDDIIEAYTELNILGISHSVETWLDGKLVGGLYGVAIGGAFFGESMVSLVPNASKIAFYHLGEHITKRGFILLDTQYMNEHTSLLGAIEIPIEAYLQILAKAIKLPVRFI